MENIRTGDGIVFGAGMICTLTGGGNGLREAGRFSALKNDAGPPAKPFGKHRNGVRRLLAVKGERGSVNGRRHF